MMMNTSRKELMMLAGKVYFSPFLNTLFLSVNLMSLFATLSVVFYRQGSSDEAIVW
jgi:hypothetical protein